MVTRILYKMGKASPKMRCLGENETAIVLMEVQLLLDDHENKIRQNSLINVRSFGNILTFHHTLTKVLNFVTYPLPFHQCGLDILGPFLLVLVQLKILLVWVEYFTKSIEAKAVPKSQQRESNAFGERE